MADDDNLILMSGELKLKQYGVAYTKAAAVEIAAAKWAHADKYSDRKPQLAVMQFVRRRMDAKSKAFGNEIDVTNKSVKVVYAATALPVGGYAVTVHVVNMSPLSQLRVEVETGSEPEEVELMNTTKRVFPE